MWLVRLGLFLLLLTEMATSKQIREPHLSQEEMQEMLRSWDAINLPTANDLLQRDNKAITVNVEGLIGAGKSTFLNFFRDCQHVDVLNEPVSQWTDVNGTDLLQLFFEKPERWALAQESNVQLSMLLHHLKKSKTMKIMERSIHSARIVFVESLRQQGNMKEVEANIVDEWYKFLNKLFDLKTDLTIYLRSTPSVVQSNIRQRARPEERSVPLELLEELHQLHDDWLIHQNSSFPLPSRQVVVIDTAHPFEEMAEVYEQFVHKLWNLVPKDIRGDQQC